MEKKKSYIRNNFAYICFFSFSPINQISTGMGNLLGVEGEGSPKTLSYSAIMKKEPLSNNTKINNVRKVSIKTFCRDLTITWPNVSDIRPATFTH